MAVHLCHAIGFNSYWNFTNGWTLVCAHNSFTKSSIGIAMKTADCTNYETFVNMVMEAEKTVKYMNDDEIVDFMREVRDREPVNAGTVNAALNDILKKKE